MTPLEVTGLVRAEIGGRMNESNSHGVDLRRCLVPPHLIRCRNTFPHPDRPEPPFLDLWLVLEETPGSTDGYLIVFNDSLHRFGLADYGPEGPVFLGYHGTFWATFKGM